MAIRGDGEMHEKKHIEWHCVLPHKFIRSAVIFRHASRHIQHYYQEHAVSQGTRLLFEFPPFIQGPQSHGKALLSGAIEMAVFGNDEKRGGGRSGGGEAGGSRVSIDARKEG